MDRPLDRGEVLGEPRVRERLVEVRQVRHQHQPEVRSGSLEERSHFFAFASPCELSPASIEA